MKAISKPLVVSISDAALRLGLSTNRVYSLCRNSLLQSVRENGRVMIEESSVEMLVAKRRWFRMTCKPKHLRLIVDNDK